MNRPWWQNKLPVLTTLIHRQNKNICTILLSFIHILRQSPHISNIRSWIFLIPQLYLCDNQVTQSGNTHVSLIWLEVTDWLHIQTYIHTHTHPLCLCFLFCAFSYHTACDNLGKVKWFFLLAAKTVIFIKCESGIFNIGMLYENSFFALQLQPVT